MVDKFFSVSPVTSHLEGVTFSSETSSGTSKFEGPQEVVGLLEVRTNSVDLVNEVFNSADAVLSEHLFDRVIGLKGDSLSVDFAISSLENEFSDGFSGRITIGDVGFDSSEHIDGSFVDSNEDSIVELSESKKSHDSDDLGVEFVNTSDSNDKGKSGFGGYVDLTGGFGLNR